jgi:putative ABC transport system permease protein
MAFIIIGGAVNSLKHSFVSWMDAWLRGELVISHSSVERNLVDTAFDLGLADRLKQIEGVRLVWPWRAMPIEWQGQHILLEAYHESGIGSIHFDIEQGSEQQAWNGLLGGDSVVISTNLSSRYGVNQGDEITLATNSGSHSFRIAAVVTDYNSEAGSIIVSFKDLERYWGDARANYFQLFLTPGASSDQVKASILSSLGNEYPLTVQKASEIKRDSLKLISKLFSLFEGLQSVALIIAILTVLNTLSISALQRVREISLVRMLGLSRREVRKSLLAEGWALGLLSWIIALPFGMLISYLAVRASSLQTGFQPDFLLPWEAGLLSLLSAVALASVAALFVDYRVARISIVSGIRYD